MSLTFELPLSPAEVLKHEYIRPSGKNLSEFARAAGVDLYQLMRMLKGSRMNPEFVQKLSLFTGRSQKYWHYLQCDYQFALFCRKDRRQKLIEPIDPKPSNPSQFSVFEDSPGQVLYQQLIKLAGRSFSSLARHTDLKEWVLRNLVEGRQRIDYRIAAKLGHTIGPNARYWMNLQMSYDISKLLGDRENLKTSLKLDLTNYAAKITNQETQALKKESVTRDVSKILTEEIFLPSKIPLFRWRQLLFVSKKLFRPMLNGQREYPLEILIKLYYISDRKVSDWIEIQIEYFSRIGVSLVAPSRHKDKIVGKNRVFPGDKLLNDHVLALNWRINDFANHIGVKPRKIYLLRHGRANLDFDLARRVGEALRIDPIYLLRLQIDHFLAKGDNASKFGAIAVTDARKKNHHK